MKKLLVVLLVLAAICAGIFIYLRKSKLQDFEPLIKEKLSMLVTNATHGLYHLDIGHLHADVTGSKIILINARLRPDTVVYARMEKSQTAPNDLFDITVSELSIDDVVAADFLVNKAIKLHRLFINKPIVKVWYKKQPFNHPDSDTLKTVYQQLRNDITSISVDSLIVQNIDFVHINKTLKNKETSLKDVRIVFSDILIDSTTQFDRDRFLFANNCLIHLKELKGRTADSLYRFQIDNTHIETRGQVVQFNKIQFTPRSSVENFYRKIGHQQDRFELSVDKISLSKIEWWAILEDESIQVRRVWLQNGSVKIFNDKSQALDPRSKMGKYPHQILMKLPFALKIDTFAISNLDLAYTELNPKSGAKGTLYFDNIDGTIVNITNNPEVIRENNLMRVNATATFMKQAPVKASFAFDLARYKQGAFSVSANMGALKGEVLNNITIPLALLKINSLNIVSLATSMKGDNTHSSGTVKMVYNNMNISALKSAGDTVKKRGLLSFVANNFIIKKDNPLNGQPVRVEAATFQRDMQKSFFNLVWKTVFTGAGKTVGYNKKK